MLPDSPMSYQGHAMPGIGAALTGVTASFAFGSFLLAQVANLPPSVSWASVALAGIGLATLWVRSHYKLKEDQLRAEEMEAELRWYRDRDRRSYGRETES